MGALILLGGSIALAGAAAPAQADPVKRWRPYIAEAAERFAIAPEWIERVMRAESGGRTTLHGRPIRSSAGAIGLMQLMPGTWMEVRARLELGHDPDDPRDNILAGAFYLSRMHARFGYPGLFAAYNAGPARYAEHLGAGRPLPIETRSYVRALSGALTSSDDGRVARTPSSALIFFDLQGSRKDSVRYLFGRPASAGYSTAGQR